MSELLLVWLLREAKRCQWCCHCKYWDEAGDPRSLTDGSLDYYGYCRRYPPSRDADEEGLAMWPFTDYDSWCGEYALNKTPALARYIEELPHDQPADEQP